MPDHIELPPDKRLEQIRDEIERTASTRKPLVIQSLMAAHGCREEDFRQMLPIWRRTVPGKIIEATDESDQPTVRYVTDAELNLFKGK